MAGKRAIKLNTVRDVKKFLSKLINQVNRDEVDEAKARSLGYLAKILLDCDKACEPEGLLKSPTSLERAIAIVEEKLLGVNPAGGVSNGHDRDNR